MPPKAPLIPPITSFVVEILAFPDVQLLDVAGPMQVFASANAQLSLQGRLERYDVRIVAPDPHIGSTAGLRFAASPLPTKGNVDTLLVAGGVGVIAASDNGVTIAWLQQRADNARRVGSVCTGAFLLAATGLLDGRRVVTHWNFCDALARKHPRIEVDRDPIFVQDGNIFTSAGVTAGIDLSLALVEQDVGRGIALDVARELVVFLKRPGGQAQYSAALDLQTKDDRFASLHHWIVANLAEPLTLQQLAGKVGMSERSFLRHYSQVTGTTPGKAVERLRVEAARQLLIESRLPLKRIAAQCGFGSEETMRRGFLRHQGISAQQFRARFSGV